MPAIPETEIEDAYIALFNKLKANMKVIITPTLNSLKELDNAQRRENTRLRDIDLRLVELNDKKAIEWQRMEGAYINIHSTKPQTLAYLLSDSPAGMAAWITEKYHAWSDWPLLTVDDILDCLTLYWMTNTACTSIRAYHGNSFTLPPLGKVTVPTAIAAFPHDVLPAPREWIEQNYPIIMYTEMPRGGHFTALEQPENFAENISQFMNSII